MASATTISKFLSKYLRHSPEELGLTLELGGWVNVDNLLNACLSHKFPITLTELTSVVTNCPKQRFSFNENKTKIRANQGHSTQVEMDFKEETPPHTLYHGTVDRFMSSILSEGLKKMNRHHVHLSKDVETARKVGERRGRPVILEINSGLMHSDGSKFYVSTNGVWLTDIVPTPYIKRI